MRHLLFAVGLALALVSALTETASASHLLEVRFGRHDDGIRVVLDLDAPTPFTQTTSSDGLTITVSLIETTVQGALARDDGGRTLTQMMPLTGYRIGVGRLPTTTEVHFSGSRPLQVLSVKTAAPGSDSKRHRIVIDLRAAPLTAPPAPRTPAPPPAPEITPPVQRLEIPEEARPEAPHQAVAQTPHQTIAEASPLALSPAETARVERLLAAAQAAAGGARPDTAKAITLYRQAADAGSPVGAFALGQIYRLGVGVEENLTLAAFWYAEAAKAGYPPAEMNLGVMQLRGAGLHPDPGAGLAMIRRAARHGNQPAQELLDQITRTEGVPESPP